MIRPLLFLLIGNSGGCASTPTMSDSSNSIRIDKGTVYLHISDAPMSQPHKIEYRAQGICEPEVTISYEGTSSNAKHVRDCHGKGRNEGTIFDIWLRQGDDHTIAVAAGQIFTPGVDSAPAISRIDASVTVGGIHGGGKETKSSRKRFLGAVSETINAGNQDGMILTLKVNMGGIDILNK